MCITAHWIGRRPQTKALHLRSEVLAFHHLPYDSHHGMGMAQVFLAMLDRAEITSKVCRQGATQLPVLTLLLRLGM